MTKRKVIIFYGNRVDDIRIQGDVINTLQARMGTGGNNMPIIFSHNQGLDPQPSDKNSPTLRANGKGMSVTESKATTLRRREGKPGGGKGPLLSEDRSLALSGVNDQVIFPGDTIVRRLTPTECERLQGFPDGWTESQALTQRYKQMGNAITVPVAEWIFHRLSDTLDL